MDKYQKALLSIKKSSLKGTLCFGKKRAVFNRYAYWVHLEEIQIPNPTLILKTLSFRLDPKKTTMSLADYILTQCDANIYEAIQHIDKIIENLNQLIEYDTSTINCNELSRFQNISTLLREIHAVTQQAKKRPGKEHDNHESRTTMTPVGPSVPGLVMSGFCCLCHRTSSHQENYYCNKHSISTGKESDIKKARRVIQKSFNNLSLRESNDDISRDAFRQKSRLLLGWAKHRVEHFEYRRNLTNIFYEYKVADELWPYESISMIRKIATLSNETNHTHRYFNQFVMIDRDKLVSQLKRDVFDLPEDTELDASLALKMLTRMSQFSLIKLAASKKNVSQLLN